MFANIQKMTLSTGKKITYFDLTLGIMDKLEQDSEFDTLQNIIACGTELKQDEIGTLRRTDAVMLYNAILRLTYPDAYNEDGTLKEIVEEELKKKAKA